MRTIDSLFRNLTATGKKAFIPYITAGDPDLAATLDVLRLLENLGADMIEVGVPFSDPMADGPVIQAAMERALRNGTTLRGTLETVAEFRRHSSLPVVLMGYFNPFHARGIERFVVDGQGRRVNGVLTVDLPPEEAGDFSALLRQEGIAPIFLRNTADGQEEDGNSEEGGARLHLPRFRHRCYGRARGTPPGTRRKGKGAEG
jgi:tryptophan synthase alpha chain